MLICIRRSSTCPSNHALLLFICCCSCLNIFLPIICHLFFCLFCFVFIVDIYDMSNCFVLYFFLPDPVMLLLFLFLTLAFVVVDFVLAGVGC